MNEEIKNLKSQAKEIHDLAAKENRDFTAEENEKFNNIMADVAKLENKFKREEQLSKLDQLEDYSKQSAGRVSEPAAVELPKETEQRYSLLRAINLVASGKRVDGLEGEVSEELALKYGKQPQGFFMPSDLSVEKYDLNTTTGTGSVGTVTDPSNFIELLRNKMMMTALGARYITGLVGNLSIPKQTGGATAYWVTEGNAPTESNATIGSVALSAKTVGAYTDLSRKFILQSSVDAEMFAREDLAAVLALELDRVGFNGSGVGAEPEGIMQNGSVTTVTSGGSAVSLANVIELETNVADGNADLGSLAYVTSAKGRGVMKGTDEGTDTGFRVWSKENTVNGYRAFATNQIPTNLTVGSNSNLTACIFGNFNDCIYGMWGGIDILVDPYTASSSGTVRIVALQDVDFKLRHVESFSVIPDLYAGA